MSEGPIADVESRPSARGNALDDVFVALGHPTRRQIIRTVAERDRCVETDHETPCIGGSDEQSTNRSIELRHRHLPRLDDSDFIDWDRETGTIERGNRFEVIEALLGEIGDTGDERADDEP